MQHASANVIDTDFWNRPKTEPLAPAAPPKKWRRVQTNKKMVAIAIIVETIIIGAVLFANWQFAERYASDDTLAWWMAIVCGVSYAAVELARVPLAITASTHRRRFFRILAVLTLLGAVVLTTKSLSQVGEQMFSHRLIEVRQARTALETVRSESRGAIDDDAAKQERIKALDAEVARLQEGIKQFGTPPAPRPVYGVRQGKRIITGYVTPAWAGATMQKELLDARARRNAMDDETKQTGVNRDNAVAEIAKAKGAYDVAVMNSQLHSFAAMLFRTSPSKVTDDQVYTFMLLFVFLGAFAGAITATGLAYCSFTRYPAMDEPDFEKPMKTQTVNIIPVLRDLHNDLKLGKGGK